MNKLHEVEHCSLERINMFNKFYGSTDKEFHLEAAIQDGWYVTENRWLKVVATR
jgi:hypothetical protein